MALNPFGKEKDYETGMDEQAKQSAMTKLSEGVGTAVKENDRSGDYYETLKYERLERYDQGKNLVTAERELALTERRNREQERQILMANREQTTHLANLKSVEHYRHGYDKLQNLEPAEAKAISEVLTGFDLQAIRAAVDVAITEALTKRKKED